MNSRQENKSGEQAYRIAYLIAGFMRGNLTIDEHNELDTWVASSDENMQLFERLTDESNMNELNEFLSRSDEQRRLEQLKSSLEFTQARTVNKMWWISGIAACLLLVCLWLCFFPISRPGEQLAKKPVPVEDVPPGNAQATLTLGSGQIIQLGAHPQNRIFNEAGVQIIEQESGILYRDSPNLQTTSIHTLTVPNRGFFQLTLSDGTKVWLNAGSTLQFPSRFEKERTVKLTGEGYFEVVKDPAKPFKVSLPEASIMVLGTRFNVKNYTDEDQAVITLLQGKIETNASNRQLELSPGQEIRITKNVMKKINEADTVAAIGWKNGFFEFHDAPIPEIMKQIERWYGVRVIFAENNNLELTAGIERSKTLFATLRALENTNRVHFKLDSGTVTVLK